MGDVFIEICDRRLKMRWILAIFSILTFCSGISVIVASKSVLHEMLGGILFVMSAIFLSGAGIVDAIYFFQTKFQDETKKIRDELRKQRLGKYPDKRPEKEQDQGTATATLLDTHDIVRGICKKCKCTEHYIRANNYKCPK